MTDFDFDAELRGADGAVVPVYCEVQPPYVGGQKSLIRVAVPAKYISKKPPNNPCTLSGKCGAFTITMQGVHWRRFPASSKGALGLEAIELLHVDRLRVQRPPMKDRKEIRFHLAPISFLRSEAGCVSFGDKSHSEELFKLDLPDLGETRFVAEWVTIYHRDAEIPGATVIAGFSAVVALPLERPVDTDQIVEKFRQSLEILSVLFRQAITLHGWTYTDDASVSTWISPLEPNVTPSARESRGDFVARPQVFVECAFSLARAYGMADEKTRSLVRDISIAINPHTKMRTNDHFLVMFSALEKVIEVAWKRAQAGDGPAATTHEVIRYLEQLRAVVVTEDGKNASEISERLRGLIGVVNRPSVRDKFAALLQVYPNMTQYCGDIWPVLGSDKMRGLREVRNALAHGRSTSVSVAEWHLAIFMERLIFVILDLSMPEGISPNSFLLERSGRGWYESERWVPLRSKPTQEI